MPPKCRVLLVDDHAQMRKALHDVLSAHADIEIIDDAADGREAVEMAADCKPDVVLLDKTMPKMNGIEAAVAIKKERTETVIIGLCTTDDAYTVEAFMKAGAAAVVNKDRVDELYPTIQGVWVRKEESAFPGNG
jgi:DNA-binding NarL/FixJ family response regulator